MTAHAVPPSPRVRIWRSATCPVTTGTTANPSRPSTRVTTARALVGRTTTCGYGCGAGWYGCGVLIGGSWRRRWSGGDGAGGDGWPGRRGSSRGHRAGRAARGVAGHRRGALLPGHGDGGGLDGHGGDAAEGDLRPRAGDHQVPDVAGHDHRGRAADREGVAVVRDLDGRPRPAHGRVAARAGDLGGGERQERGAPGERGAAGVASASTTSTLHPARPRATTPARTARAGRRLTTSPRAAGSPRAGSAAGPPGCPARRPRSARRGGPRRARRRRTRCRRRCGRGGRPPPARGPRTAAG